MKCISTLAAFVLCLCGAGAVRGEIMPGQSDSFQFDKQGWRIGKSSALTPLWKPDGGPQGVGDGYLELASTGAGTIRSKLVGLNRVQWAGDYLAADVTGIAFDVINLGSTSLEIRIAFQGTTAEERAVSLDSFVLPPGSGWQSVYFPLEPTAFFVTSDFSSLFSSVTELRILHSTVDSFEGQPIAARLGLDNITAYPASQPEPPGVLPEPTSLALAMMAGGVVLGYALRWRRRFRTEKAFPVPLPRNLRL